MSISLPPDKVADIQQLALSCQIHIMYRPSGHVFFSVM